MSQRRLTVILGLLSALGPLSIDYLPSFPSIARSLGTSVPAVQLTLAAYVSGIALGQLVHGPLSDRFGRRLRSWRGSRSTVPPRWRAPLRRTCSRSRPRGSCKGSVVAPASWNALGLVAASQLNRWAVRRVGVRRALRAGVIAAVVSHGALVLTLRCGAPLAVVLAPVFLGIASLGVVMPNATAAAMDCFDEHAGCASAILGVLQSTLDALASTAVSALADGTARPMAAVMLTCGIAALALLGVRPLRSPRVARPRDRPQRSTPAVTPHRVRRLLPGRSNTSCTRQGRARWTPG